MKTKKELILELRKLGIPANMQTEKKVLKRKLREALSEENIPEKSIVQPEPVISIALPEKVLETETQEISRDGWFKATEEEIRKYEKEGKLIGHNPKTNEILIKGGL